MNNEAIFSIEIHNADTYDTEFQRKVIKRIYYSITCSIGIPDPTTLHNVIKHPGIITFDDQEGFIQDFISFDFLTQEQIVNWISQHVDIEAIKKQLEADLRRKLKLSNQEFSFNSKYNTLGNLSLPALKNLKLQELAEWRYTKETAGIEVDFVKIKTDRESQALINAAFNSLKNGLIQSVDWKTAEGDFVTLGLDQVSAIATAVANHVQQCFSAEAVIASQISACETKEELQAVIIPWDGNYNL